jgi:hypothetical protein
MCPEFREGADPAKSKSTQGGQWGEAEEDEEACGELKREHKRHLVSLSWRSEDGLMHRIGFEWHQLISVVL